MRRLVRALAIAIALGATGALAGCSVGNGSGSAVGPLFVVGCTGASPGGDRGVPGAPVTYSLAPTFFAGDPIEGTGQPPQNSLSIRMQRNGLAIEYNDTLTFNIINSFEIARCIRGRTVNGVPDFDTTGLGLGPWCDWTGTQFGVDGGATDAGAPTDGGATALRPRIRLSSQGFIQASLALLATCPINLVKMTGPALVGHSIDGYIEFTDFGDAVEGGDAGARDPIPADFKVNFGDRLRATFTVALTDDRTLTAEQTDPTGPIPTPLIGGTLNGNFDFDMIRARAAQPFP
jgi:hypothetical protein